MVVTALVLLAGGHAGGSLSLAIRQRGNGQQTLGNWQRQALGKAGTTQHTGHRTQGISMGALCVNE